MAQGPSDTILVAIRITLRIREYKVRNPDPPDRRRFVLSECISCSSLYYGAGCCCLRAAACDAAVTDIRDLFSLYVPCTVGPGWHWGGAPVHHVGM